MLCIKEINICEHKTVLYSQNAEENCVEKILISFSTLTAREEAFLKMFL